MSYQMQILIYDKDAKAQVWGSVSPTDGPAYVFETEAEAWDMLDMCYPDLEIEKKRVMPSAK